MTPEQQLEMRFYSMCRTIYTVGGENRTAHAVPKRTRTCLRCRKDFVSTDGMRMCRECNNANKQYSERAEQVVVFERKKTRIAHHEQNT